MDFARLLKGSIVDRSNQNDPISSLKKNPKNANALGSGEAAKRLQALLMENSLGTNDGMFPDRPIDSSVVSQEEVGQDLTPDYSYGMTEKGKSSTTHKASIPEAAQAQAESIAPIEADPQTPQGPGFLKMIENAQGESEQQRSDARLLRASERIGAGLSRSATDHSSSDQLMSQAGQSLEDTKAQIGGIKEQQSFDKSTTDINDEKQLSDPNSAISQETVAQLAKYGINVKTALQAKQLNPQIFNLLMADRAQKNAKEVASMTVESSKNKQESALDEKQRKFARDLRKEATTGVLGKQYATYSTGQRMQSGLEQFAKNPSGYKDYATLMGGLKTLQGDESVVREAEVRLGINATSAINKASNYLQAAMNGQQLQPSQRQEMIDTIKILTEASKLQYLQSAAPILEQADMEGIPHSMILSGSLSGAGKPSESQGLTTSNSKTRTFKSQQAPGSVVTVKSGQKYKIGPDGVTGTEI